jgi:fumarate hydratase class II
MNSGPRCGLGEVTLPAIQPGSSIMPGKVNPVICEAVIQVGAQVMGNHVAITVGAQWGQLDLNTMLPLIARNLLESIRLLTTVSRAFADKALPGLTANAETCLGYVESRQHGDRAQSADRVDRAAEIASARSRSAGPCASSPRK